MKRTIFIVGFIFVLVGCASTSDIDLSKLETNCAHDCTKTYSNCVSNYTVNSHVLLQRACTDALRLCAQTCPPK